MSFANFRSSIQIAMVLLIAAISTACSPGSAREIELAAGAGSAEPHLAIGPDHTIVLSFLEPTKQGTSLRYVSLSDNQWTAPKTLASGKNWFVNWADFPSVEPLTKSLWAAHWLVQAGNSGFAYDAVVSVSRDAGESWSDPTKLHTDGTLTEHGFVSLYPTGGGVGAVWLDGRAMVADHSGVGTQLRGAQVIGGVLSQEHVLDALVCDCCQTDVAVAKSGPVTVYRNRTESEIRDIYVARFVDGAWGPGVQVAHDGWEMKGCPINGPAIDATGDRVAVAWYTGSPRNRVQVAVSTDSGKTFEEAIDVDASNPIGRVDVSLLEDGSAVVSWVERGVGRLMVRRVYGANQLGESLMVTEMETHKDAGFPQMVASADGLVFAWTDTMQDTSRVRTLLMAYP